MGDSDTVAVQYEIRREDAKRIIKIEENDLEWIRPIIDEIIQIAEITAQSEKPVNPNVIESITNISDLDDSFYQWVNNLDKTQSQIEKIDVYRYLGVIEKNRSGYKPPENR